MHSDHTTPLKTCSKCGQSKPATTEHFNRHNKGADGLRPDCKVCQSGRNRAYRTANRESIAKRGRSYRTAIPEIIAKRKHDYGTANAERVAKRKRNYWATNKDRFTERRRAYRAANPEANRANHARRRARKLAAEGKHTVSDVRRQYELQSGKCYWCDVPVGDTYHVDHIIALARGGSNGPENLCISCSTCNLSKKDKLPTEWDGNRNGRLL